MDLATNLTGDVTISNAQPSPITGTHWSGVEEGILQALVQRANLSKRTTTEQWEKLAVAYNLSAEPLGFPRRTGSGCRNKARAMGLNGSTRVAAPPVPVVVHQASFAAPEVKAEVNRSLVAILRHVADELERGA